MVASSWNDLGRLTWYLLVFLLKMTFGLCMTPLGDSHSWPS
jgi:hypothetical protein